MTQFYSIDYNKAGYILKKVRFVVSHARGRGSYEIGRRTDVAYRKWKQEKDLDEDDAEDEENPEKETIINIEQLEEQANEGIRQYIKAKNPYEFQDMVAALLRAMGYYTPFGCPERPRWCGCDSLYRRSRGKNSAHQVVGEAQARRQHSGKRHP